MFAYDKLDITILLTSVAFQRYQQRDEFPTTPRPQCAYTHPLPSLPLYTEAQHYVRVPVYAKVSRTACDCLLDASAGYGPRLPADGLIAEKLTQLFDTPFTANRNPLLLGGMHNIFVQIQREQKRNPVKFRSRSFH